MLDHRAAEEMYRFLQGFQGLNLPSNNGEEQS